MKEKKSLYRIDQLVEGDLVRFQAGDQIYADGVLLEGELKVDESQLTGEADEVKKEHKMRHVR